MESNKNDTNPNCFVESKPPWMILSLKQKKNYAIFEKQFIQRNK